MAKTVTKPKTNGQIPIQIFQETLNRALLAARMGTQTYSGDRDMDQALGYPTDAELNYKLYLQRYQRQDMAKAIIDRPVNATWKGNIDLVEMAGEEKTSPLENAWNNLYKERKLKHIFKRLDRLTRLGQYSVLFFGLSDTTNKESFSKPASKGAQLMYLKPCSEETAKIKEFETNVTNARYGLPKTYEISFSEPGRQDSGTMIVHHTRVLHVTSDILEDEVYGTPELKAVFNRLIDLEKVVGGDAEMYWRGARPGYTGTARDDYQVTADTKTDLQDMLKDFEHNMTRFLVNEGIDFKALEQQIADPANHVDVIVQTISAVTGIPKRILVGSERGELSSSQDKQEWVSYITTRREEVVEVSILRPFIDRCIEIGILPNYKNTDGYTIVWDRLFSLTDKEKAEIGKARSVILKEYALSITAQDIIPMRHFLKHFLGFDDKAVDSVKEDQPDVIREPPDTSRLREAEVIKAEGNKRIKDT